MKPTKTRLGTFWCRLMHNEAMWPSRGQYECRTCGRRHPVCWEQTVPALMPAACVTQSPDQSVAEARIS